MYKFFTHHTRPFVEVDSNWSKAVQKKWYEHYGNLKGNYMKNNDKIEEIVEAIRRKRDKL